jgi:uncharacterized OB-fold protein
MTEKAVSASPYFESEFRVRYDYLYSLGGLSPFFRSLKDDQRILGTTCSRCAVTYCPPRVHCRQCRGVAEWTALSGQGTVRAASFVTFVPRSDLLLAYIDLPYTMAMIQLDGTDDALLSIVHLPGAKLGDVRAGMRVHAVFRERREGRLTDFYFVPTATT